MRLSFEHKLLLLILFASVPSWVGLVALMLSTGKSVYLSAIVALILFLIIAYCTATITNKTSFLFRTLSNLLEAMTTGDYSMRGRGELTKSALGDLVLQINTLSETLASQRLEVKEHQLLLGKIINQIDVAIIAIDNQQNLSLVNPAAAKLFNLQVAQLIGTSAVKFNLNKLIDSAEQSLVQWTFPKRSGQFTLHTDQFIEGGNTHQLLFITDVRELLRGEERKTWQNLIRVLSHEINNSLTPISSLSQTLSRMIERSDNLDEDKPDLQDGLNLIHERANSLKTFIDSYRQLSRLPEPKRQVVLVEALVDNVISLFEHREIMVKCPSDLKANLDPVQIEQLLINLIKNADEAMSNLAGDGEIVIECATHNNTLDIKIKDQGPGLSNTDNLFVPFYTTKANGSGIGLVLSRQIVEAHQGDLTLVNRDDAVGCEVCVSIVIV